MSDAPGVELYRSASGDCELAVRADSDSVWLSADQFVALFGRGKSTISRHLRNVFTDGELDQASVVADFATTAADGKSYSVAHDNLEVIISVGYRVKSPVRSPSGPEPNSCQDGRMTVTYPPRTNNLALVGFIASFMIPIVGIVLGVMARRQIAVTKEGGRGLARAAVILGALGTTFQVIFFIVWLSLFSTALSQAPIFR